MPPEPILISVDKQLNLIAVERDRIAGELHDDSVQAMTAVSLQLQRLRPRATSAEQLALIDQARHAADEAIERLRHMLFVLHPSSLEDDGLVMTLEIYMENYVEPAGIESVVSGETDTEIPIGVAALGFRLAREAIANATGHASPSKVNVNVGRVDDELIINITDDGCGFEIKDQTFKAGHLGLKHSRALARAAQGSYAVDSIIGTGTTVRIALPAPTGDATDAQLS